MGAREGAETTRGGQDAKGAREQKQSVRLTDATRNKDPDKWTTELRTFFSINVCAFAPVAFVLLTLDLRCLFPFLFLAFLSILIPSL